MKISTKIINEKKSIDIINGAIIDVLIAKKNLLLKEIPQEEDFLLDALDKCDAALKEAKEKLNSGELKN